MNEMMRVDGELKNSQATSHVHKRRVLLTDEWSNPGKSNQIGIQLSPRNMAAVVAQAMARRAHRQGKENCSQKGLYFPKFLTFSHSFFMSLKPCTLGEYGTPMRSGNKNGLLWRVCFYNVSSMTRVLLCGLLMAASLLLGGCNPPAPVATATTNSRPASSLQVDPTHGHLLHANPKLPTVKVWVGSEELTAEVASRGVEIATGMMFRTNMLENEAMIFVFGDVGQRSFYMRNCVVPLSAAYINPNGEILEIIKLEPGNEIGVASRSDKVQFVLEVPQGWFDRHNVRTGMIVRTDRGSLLDTFIRRQ
jgi:uncharacterized membrane protein (UPF0127 family)